MARPTETGTKRTEVFQLRLTAEEYRKARYLAECFDKPLAKYIRDIIDANYKEAVNKKIEVIIEP